MPGWFESASVSIAGEYGQVRKAGQKSRTAQWTGLPLQLCTNHDQAEVSVIVLDLSRRFTTSFICTIDCWRGLTSTRCGSKFDETWIPSEDRRHTAPASPAIDEISSIRLQQVDCPWLGSVDTDHKDGVFAVELARNRDRRERITSSRGVCWILSAHPNRCVRKQSVVH